MDSKTQTRDGAVVARQTVNLSVLGSNPSREKPAGYKRTGSVPEWFKGTDLRSVGRSSARDRNPSFLLPRGHKAQTGRIG